MNELTCGCEYVDSLILSFCDVHKYPGPESHKDGKGIIIRDLESENSNLRAFLEGQEQRNEDLQAKLSAAILQIETLKKETADYSALASSYKTLDTKYGESNRLNQVLQNRMAEIVKVTSKPGSLFPKSMAEMNPIEGKIAIVACELSGDLSYIKGLAESPITENRKEEGGNPWAPNKDYHSKPTLTGKCHRCGSPKMKGLKCACGATYSEQD